MVRLTYRPWNQIVIHEIIENEPDELFTTTLLQAIAQGGAGFIPSINWVDGIAFVLGLFPDTEDVVRDKMKGIVHFGSVQFARFPEYKSEISVPMKGNSYLVRLVNNEKNPVFVELSRFLKDSNFKKTKK